MRERVSRGYLYYRRGYMIVGIVLGLGSTIGIWYELLGFKTIFSTVNEFAIVFLPVIIIGCLIWGWFDIRKGTFAEEARLSFESNPAWLGMIRQQDRIEKKLEELDKCVKERY